MTKPHLSLLSSLGLAIRVNRERCGLSQEALASKAGLHRTYVSSVERGQRNLALINIVEISNALGISASQLLAEVEKIEGGL